MKIRSKVRFSLPERGLEFVCNNLNCLQQIQYQQEVARAQAEEDEMRRVNAVVNVSIDTIESIVIDIKGLIDEDDQPIDWKTLDSEEKRDILLTDFKFAKEILNAYGECINPSEVMEKK